MAKTGVDEIDSVSCTRDGFNALPLFTALLNSPLCNSQQEKENIMKLLNEVAQQSETNSKRMVKTHRMHLLSSNFQK